MKITYVAFVFAANAFAGVFAAHATDQSFISRLADGREWNAQPDGGPQMKMVFNPNGTGQMKLGFMSRKLEWQSNGNGICMTGLPDGNHCILFKPTANGFVGTSDDGKSMVLSR